MKFRLFLLLLLPTYWMAACAETPDPEPQPEPIKTFMLAIIEPSGQIPFDFEADEAIGDYNPETGLLRIEGTSLLNGTDKIEITIKDAGETVPGSYVIGQFGSSSAKVKAEFLDGNNTWNARSISGSLKITKFERTEFGNSFFLSATFAFKAEANGQEVQIRSGEIENAVLLEA